MNLADYQRLCVELTMKQLERILDSKTFATLQTFYNITDFYGQIYILRDLTNGVK